MTRSRCFYPVEDRTGLHGGMVGPIYVMFIEARLLVADFKADRDDELWRQKQRASASFFAALCPLQEDVLALFREPPGAHVPVPVPMPVPPARATSAGRFRANLGPAILPKETDPYAAARASMLLRGGPDESKDPPSGLIVPSAPKLVRGSRWDQARVRGGRQR